MGLMLYNTLTREKELFYSITPGEVRMYVCGPTVNDVPHLGHARQQITYDLLRKYLKFLGYNVKFVSNVTDIDDKIINKAKDLNEDMNVMTQRNLKAHLEDYAKIGVEKPTIQPKATEFVSQMVELIELLEKKGYAYVIPEDGVYYDTSKFDGYGKLSHQNTNDLLSGVRIEAKESKRNKADFVLWKFSKPFEPKWSSPWGEGRPGWHIECSAMSNALLGLPLDIHGGGQDLIFPHHEDELAQSEAAFEKKLSNFWVHNGMVNVDKVKMSKSLGNYKTIRDLLENFSGEVIRYFVISAHYHGPIDFSQSSLVDAKNSYTRLKKLVLAITNDEDENKEYLLKFTSAMDDDLATPRALSVLWELIRDTNAKGKYNTIKKIDSIFGLNLFAQEAVEIPQEIIKLYNEREDARKSKDWAKADEIRVKINASGYTISDSQKGSKIEKLEN